MTKIGFQNIEIFTTQKKYSGSFEEVRKLVSKNFPVKAEKQV